MGAAISILVIIIGIAVIAAVDGEVIGVDATWIGLAAIVAGVLGLFAWLIAETRREGERARRYSGSDSPVLEDREERYETATDAHRGPLI